MACVRDLKRLQRFWRRMWKTKCVFDSYEMLVMVHFGHQYPLSFDISVKHQHSKDVTNIEILSPSLGFQHHCHQVKHMPYLRVMTRCGK